MDVSRPGRVALPPGTEAVLRALAGTDADLGVREVARIAGVSPNRASQVLSELADHGVVVTELRGSGRFSRLNRAHLATAPLVALVELRSRIVDFLREEVTSWERRPLHASLFGSAARGDGGTGSDLDLLVVRPPGGTDADDDAWDEQLVESGDRIRAATGNRASWFVTTTDDLERAVRSNEPVVTEWRRDGIHLAGQRLATLLRRIA
jgi:DNA-binding transcriptional ArsR family regulator